MKKLISLFLISFYLSCNTAETNSNAAPDSMKTSATSTEGSGQVTYAYPMNYSSSFAPGDPKNGQMILQLWKDYDNNVLQNAKDNFADTVTMLMSGMEMHGPKDSILNSSQQYRNTFLNVTSTVDVVMSVKATDKNEDWVLVWGTEHHTDKKNKTDSLRLQEVWRINKAGKVDYMEQYVRQFPPAMKK